jgi:predicted nucleotidyltransferase component of viral defense system
MSMASKQKVRVMDIREITAEKIRAMSDRIRYRDFYDFAMILKKLAINLDEVLDLVRKKEVLYPISKKKIIDNWNLAKLEKQADISQIYYIEELKEKEVKDQLLKLNFTIID